MSASTVLTILGASVFSQFHAAIVIIAGIDHRRTLALRMLKSLVEETLQMILAYASKMPSACVSLMDSGRYSASGSFDELAVTTSARPRPDLIWSVMHFFTSLSCDKLLSVKMMTFSPGCFEQLAGAASIYIVIETSSISCCNESLLSEP